MICAIADRDAVRDAINERSGIPGSRICSIARTIADNCAEISADMSSPSCADSASTGASNCNWITNGRHAAIGALTGGSAKIPSDNAASTCAIADRVAAS